MLKSLSITNDIIIDIIEEMSSRFNQEDLAFLRNILTTQLYKYNLSAKSTELVVYDENEDLNMYKKFFAVKKLKGLTIRSLNFYKNSLDDFFKIVQKSIKDIETDDIRYYLSTKMMTATAVTVNGYRRAVSSFFTFLLHEEYITKNPMWQIEKIKEKKQVKQPFSAEDIEKIRDKIKNIRDEALFEFLYSTGCRVSEAVNCNIEDVNFNKNEVIVLGKGNKERTVYLNAKAKFILQKYIESRTDNNKALFATLDSPYNRLKASGIEIVIRQLGKEAGVENAHPHRMRRTAATRALRAGMPIEQVQKMLGHESIDTTQIYARIDQSDLKRSHERMM